MNKKIILFLLVASFAALAAPALAQQNPAPELFVSFRSNDFNTVMVAIVKMILGIIGIFSILYLVWGGFQYLTSGANSDLAKQGAKTVRSAITGLIIAILSYIIVTVVVNSLFGLP
jgi:amino acid permease